MRPAGSVRSRAHNATNFKQTLAMRKAREDVWLVSEVLVWRRSALVELAGAGGWRGQERQWFVLAAFGWARFETPPALVAKGNQVLPRA